MIIECLFSKKPWESGVTMVHQLLEWWRTLPDSGAIVAIPRRMGEASKSIEDFSFDCVLNDEIGFSGIENWDVMVERIFNTSKPSGWLLGLYVYLSSGLFGKVSYLNEPWPWESGIDGVKPS